jgi:hypothetical protein
MMCVSVLFAGCVEDAEDEFEDRDDEFVFELDEADEVDDVDKRVALALGFRCNSSKTVFGLIVGCCCWITRLGSAGILLFSLDLILLIFISNLFN